MWFRARTNISDFNNVWFYLAVLITVNIVLPLLFTMFFQFFQFNFTVKNTLVIVSWIFLNGINLTLFFCIRSRFRYSTFLVLTLNAFALILLGNISFFTSIGNIKLLYSVVHSIIYQLS